MDATSGPLAEKRERYIKAFQEQRTQKVIEQFAAEHIPTPAALEKKFQDKTLKLFELEVGGQNNESINHLLEKVQKENLDLNVDINAQVKDQVEELNTQKQEVMKVKPTEMDKKYQKKIKEKIEAGNKNLFANLFRSVQKHNKDQENED